MNPENSLQTRTSQHHQWLERAIEEKNIRYFDYSHFKDFEFLAAGEFGKVQKAIYDFAGAEIPYVLKSIFNLQDAKIERKALYHLIIMNL